MIKAPRQFIFGTGTTVTSAPASEPFTTATVKEWLKVDYTDDDTLIGSLITAARQYVENYTGLKLFTQTVQEVWDELPLTDENYNHFGGFSLSWWPVQSITTFAYVDESGDPQTITSANYDADLVSRPARMSSTYGVAWPVTRDEMKAVTVTYVAGYAATTDIPDDIKVAMRLIIADWYDNRGDNVRERVTAADCILRQYKLNVFQ